MNRSITNHVVLKNLAVFAALVVAGVVARVTFQDIPNFAPVAAIAMFAGYYFGSRMLAISVPVSIMLISDRLIDAGGYPWLLMMSVYGLLACPVLLQSWLKDSVHFENRGLRRIATSLLTVGGCSLGCSLVFFFGTNAMVWATTSLYPQTAAGLVTCYAAALPFFRYTLAGDLAFSAVFFGSYAVAKLACQSAVSAPATIS